ncbi:MAG: hypothetical protein L0H93_04990 [Nocardioides sp.]|nr:hypothetical protein [Nocardioides sp.]
MDTSSDPRRVWQWGYGLIMVVPFIGVALTFTDPPLWAQIVGVVAIVVLVATGSTLMRRRAGGWRPSETVSDPHGNAR